MENNEKIQTVKSDEDIEKEKKRLKDKINLQKFHLKNIEENIKRSDDNVDIFSKEIQKWQMKKIEFQTMKSEKESEIIALERDLKSYNKD